MLRCLKCGGLLENRLRKYHPDCWKVTEHELGVKRNSDRAAWYKLSNREKRALVFIVHTLTNPTQEQLKDVCIYYSVDCFKIKELLYLSDYIEKYESNDCYRRGTYDIMMT